MIMSLNTRFAYISNIAKMWDNYLEIDRQVACAGHRGAIGKLKELFTMDVHHLGVRSDTGKFVQRTEVISDFRMITRA